MELTHDEIKAILERQREICGKGYLLYCKDHNLNASTICQRMIKGASEPYVNEEYYNYNNSNRLDGVVIQKPADECKLHSFIEGGEATCEDCKKFDIQDVRAVSGNLLSMEDATENIEAIRVEEYGNGYAEGIKTINEVHTNSQKLLLDECCEALGWQGGTIHEITKVLKASKNLFNTWNGYKETLKGREDDANFRKMRISLNQFSEAIR
jgi:hypothetical protein